jgi:ribonuclease T2
MPHNVRGPAALLALIAAIGVGLFQLFSGGDQGQPQTAPSAHTAPTVQPDERLAAAGETGAANRFGETLPASARTPNGDFDYYILALSWSPTYCLEEADPQRDRRQCQAARPFAFVLHGLWPQHERGYPEKCQTPEPRVPDAILDTMMDIMPSRGLAGHQWRKHGACTGLDQADYFAASRAAFAAVTIPAAFKSVSQYLSTSPEKVEQAFLAANPGLSRDGVTVTCTRKHLREVRVCLTKDLKFRACGADARRDCNLNSIVMPPARGGR